MKSLVSGAEFHDFEKSPKFIGKLVGQQLREKDGTGENQKAGSIIGFTFVDEDGETHLIGNSHAIEKAVGLSKLGAVLSIEFRGQSEVNGKKINRFKIDELEEGDDGYFTADAPAKGKGKKKSDVTE